MKISHIDTTLELKIICDERYIERKSEVEMWSGSIAIVYKPMNKINIMKINGNNKLLNPKRQTYSRMTNLPAYC